MYAIGAQEEFYVRVNLRGLETRKCAFCTGLVVKLLSPTSTMNDESWFEA